MSGESVSRRLLYKMLLHSNAVLQEPETLAAKMHCMAGSHRDPGNFGHFDSIVLIKLNWQRSQLIISVNCV